MNNDDNNYQPISCELYSEYELAIIRNQKIKLVWQVGEQIHIGIIKPLDLQTHEHQEFLIGQNHQKRLHKIRLDHIRSQEFIG
ncbi:MAG: Rho-binding antiterminator [Gammaproteobacteria bacterium]|nr:Rho-binding antiterminator [Gammaproteobacteria bacterium]